jgi:hypothetical protein
MASYRYGASTGDFVAALSGGFLTISSGQALQVWTAPGGSQITELYQATGTALTKGSAIGSPYEVTSDSSGRYPFWGPDGEMGTLWLRATVSAGVYAWYPIDPELGNQVETNTNSLTSTAATVAQHETRIDAIEALPTGTTPQIRVQDLLYRAIAQDGITVPDDFPQYINQARLAAYSYTKAEVDTKLAGKLDVLGTWTQADAVLAVGTGAQRFYAPYACTIVQVRASVVTAPTGASLIVDVNKNGVTIFGTQSARPTIAASSLTAVSGTPTVTTLAAGDYLTVDIDQIGSTVAGGYLTVTVTVRA